MGLKEVLGLIDDVAKLGASPAVQSLLTAWCARLLGVPQNVLDAAIAASKDAPPPKTA